MKPSKEIDIMAIVGQIFKHPKSLAVCVTSSVLLGIIVALTTPKVYTASVVLAPEMSAGGLGLSGGLADMASNFGVDLNSAGKGMDAIYPEIYPELFTSYDFIHSLFSVPVRTEKSNKTCDYAYHLTKQTKNSLLQYPKVWLSSLMKKTVKAGSGKADPFKMSRDEAELCDGISGNIMCMVDKKTSVITISVKDQDPLVAAILADTLQRRLQTYITDYRTKKARTDYGYYKKLYSEAKAKYTKVQQKYAAYCDANQDIVLESFQTKRDELENNMQLAFNTMSQLNTQLQNAEAKIQERTPAFTILSEAKMPYKASSTPRSFVVIIFAMLGVVIDVLWLICTNRRKKNYEEESELQNKLESETGNETEK